jgi:hypothetical protein
MISQLSAAYADMDTLQAVLADSVVYVRFLRRRVGELEADSASSPHRAAPAAAAASSAAAAAAAAARAAGRNAAGDETKGAMYARCRGACHQLLPVMPSRPLCCNSTNCLKQNNLQSYIHVVTGTNNAPLLPQLWCESAPAAAVVM